MALDRHFHQALKFLAARGNVFPFEQMISGTYSLAGTIDAQQAMAEPREVKPVTPPQA